MAEGKAAAWECVRGRDCSFSQRARKAEVKEERIYGICKLLFVRRCYRCLQNSASNDVFPLAIHADISLFNRVWDKKYGSCRPRRRAAHLDAELGRRGGREAVSLVFPGPVPRSLPATSTCAGWVGSPAAVKTSFARETRIATAVPELS